MLIKDKVDVVMVLSDTIKTTTTTKTATKVEI